MLIRSLALLAFMYFPAVATAQDCDPASLPDVVSVFEGRSTDSMVNCTAAIQMAYPVHQESFDFLKSLWKQDKERHPNVSWDLIEGDIVKVHLAAAMAQGFHSQALDIQPVPIHEYLVQAMANNDPHVVSQAILSIATFDDPSDVDPIVHVALQDNESLFMSAVTALAMMCKRSASIGLDRVLGEVKNPRRMAYLKQRRGEFEDLKKRSGYCGQ